jgi:predicted transcriptional regulator of viral defense system
MDSSDSSLDPCLIRLARDRGGLVTARSVADRGISRATLRRAVDTGRLIRVAHGAYVQSRRWTAAGERARHPLRLQAAPARTPTGVAVAQSSSGCRSRKPSRTRSQVPSPDQRRCR